MKLRVKVGQHPAPANAVRAQAPKSGQVAIGFRHQGQPQYSKDWFTSLL